MREKTRQQKLRNGCFIDTGSTSGPGSILLSIFAAAGFRIAVVVQPAIVAAPIGWTPARVADRAYRAGCFIFACACASGEAATGRIDLNLLEKICKITGGTVFDKSIDRLPLHTSNYRQFVDLTPLLLKLLLIMLLVDISIRRWKNIRGMFALFKRDR
jgi:hypothetical protein